VRRISILMLVLVGAAAWASPAIPANQPTPKGEDEFRAAWKAFAAPARTPGNLRTAEARQEARLAAMPHIEAALAADPQNPVYHASLAYIRLAAGKYQQAREAIVRALELKQDDPLLHLLCGQAEAALAQMEPAKAGERIGPPLKEFARAAELDPTNALPLLQGASVAFDVGRKDLALPMVKQALDRPRFVLYRLSVPGDLDPDPKVAGVLWQYVQLGQWMELLARCENVAKALLRPGEEKQAAGDLRAAETHYRQALDVGGKIGTAAPSLFITTNVAIDMMEGAYTHLLSVAEAKGSPDAERWRGELAVLQIGRTGLYGALQRYLKRLEEDPPRSIEELLGFEAECVEETILGIGLTPSSKAPAPPLSERQPRPAEPRPASSANAGPA